MKRRVYRIKARRLIDALARLDDAGVRLPSFTVSRTRVAYSAVPERLHVIVGKRRIGTITRSGVFRPTRKLTKLQVAVVRAFVENPLDVARGAAILLGLEARCPVCGRVLDSKDRLRGIGPKCYEKGGFERLETAKPDRVVKKP